MGFAALAVMAFLALSNWRIFESRRVLDAQVAESRKDLQMLEERRAALKAGLDAAQGEGFQEERMREQGYKKPGEEVIAVLQDGAGDATTNSEGLPASGGGFWMDLWEKVKNLNP